MKKLKNKRAISLIVLVITIIVMVILAGAIILSLNNSGIIDEANNAVDKTNEATIKEIAQLGWAEAYADYGADVAKLEEGVISALTKNKLEPEEYAIKVTTSGVKIKAKKDMWIKDGLTLVRGEDVLEIGDTINYTATGTTYNGEWKVLGADEDGNLLILSADNVKANHTLGYTSSETTSAARLAKSQNNWLNVALELDGVCEPYGKGAYAIGARSITVEDVNSVTGYDPEAAEQVIFKYNGTTKPRYEFLNGKSGSLTKEHTNGFYWYDEKGFHNVVASDLTNGANDGKEIAKVKYDFYFYKYTKTDLSEDSDAFKMIYGISGNWKRYFLSGYFAYVQTNVTNYAVSAVYSGFVNGSNVWCSTGEAFSTSSGVRAVVTLQSSIPMENLVK